PTTKEAESASSRATGSRECAPDDRLREATQQSLHASILDCFVAEPVIGFAEGETRWPLVMTAREEATMKNTPFDLTGQVAVITASGRGIGRASAALLARLGAKVVISSRKVDACKEVADGINGAGGDAHVIPCNISRRDEVEALIAGATKRYGKIDI